MNPSMSMRHSATIMTMTAERTVPFRFRPSLLLFSLLLVLPSASSTHHAFDTSPAPPLPKHTHLHPPSKTTTTRSKVLKRGDPRRFIHVGSSFGFLSGRGVAKLEVHELAVHYDPPPRKKSGKPSEQPQPTHQQAALAPVGSFLFRRFDSDGAFASYYERLDYEGDVDFLLTAGDGVSPAVQTVDARRPPGPCEMSTAVSEHYVTAPGPETDAPVTKNYPLEIFAGGTPAPPVPRWKARLNRRDGFDPSDVLLTFYAPPPPADLGRAPWYATHYSLYSGTSDALDRLLPLTTKEGAHSAVFPPVRTSDGGLYFLLFERCAGDPPADAGGATFHLDFTFSNHDPGGATHFLGAGEVPLPRLFLACGALFGACAVAWVRRIQRERGERRGKPVKNGVHQIHHLMTVVLVLKTCTLLAESVRYHYIDKVGYSEPWAVVYFTFAFLKGVSLFIVILLIGSGWSFLRPSLNENEKKVVALVLLLQVANNIALVVMNAGVAGTVRYNNWRNLLHVVDIVCCCAIMMPIVWQTKALENSLADDQINEAEGEGEPEPGRSGGDQRILRRLKLFRSFYCIVVAYIYMTRIGVYLVASMLDYQHTWVRYFLEEALALAFYIITGYMFRPGGSNPYFEGRDDAEGETEMKPLAKNLESKFAMEPNDV